MIAPEAPFDAPWQAQVFALTVALNEAGHFTWAEWVACLGPRVQHAGAHVYWRAWSDTLVEILVQQGVAERAEVAALTARWHAAARTTPHGQPVVLSPAP